MNEDSKNRDLLKKLIIKYDNERVVTLTYYSQVNEMIERDHRFIFDALFKMIEEEKIEWIAHLSAVLWVDRFIVKIIIDRTSFYLLCENDLVLSIELELFIWKVLSWKEMRITIKLIAIRARQLKRQNEDLEKAKNMFERMRRLKKSVWFNSWSARWRIEKRRSNIAAWHSTYAWSKF